jgi:uncharacterized 2Fe-2S/4Fe-4S cluster protein (DUF4445 family)
VGSVLLKISSPSGQRTLSVAPEHAQSRLTEILRAAGLPLNTRCGQRSRCDGCLVELLEGRLVRIATGEILSANEHPLLIRACEYRPSVAACVRIPPRSMLAYEPQVVTEFRINVPRAHDPLWQEIALSPNDRTTAVGQAFLPVPPAVGQAFLPVAPSVAQASLPVAPDAPRFATIERGLDGWVVTRIADTRAARALGVAIDIGTTTVALLLVDLRDGRIVASAADFNQQMHLGDDVLTRIHLCSDPAMLRRLQRAVAHDTIGPLLHEALEQAKASHADVRCLAVAGNTTMLHLLAGVDPTPIGVVPFTPAFLGHRIEGFDAIFPPPHPHSPAPPQPHAPSRVHLLPGAAAYVGADLTAGALASGLLYDDGPSLLVDVGTNGEIILRHDGKLFGCATAAGPAFEGAGLSSGIRAGDGAVSHIRLSISPFSIHCQTIGQERGIKSIGICGSAYVDFLAEARRIGLLNTAGRYDPQAVPDARPHLVPWTNSDVALRIAPGHGRHEILISQADVASLLQAKAAIAAGTLTLLERRGLSPADVKTVYLAGGFGTHMSAANAIGCGLLPGFQPQQIQPVGNTSLAGALMALLDAGALAEIARAGRQIEIIELNLDPNFESRFIDQLFLPD